MQENKIENNKPSILIYAMNYGALLGLLWAFKYLVFVGQDMWKHLIYFYYLLNAATFLLIYISYFKYRDSVSGEQKRRYKCIIFIVLLCFFASFFECGMMFLHYQVLDPSYFTSKVEPTLRAVAEAMPYFSKMDSTALNLLTNKFYYIFSTFMTNLFVGGFLGVLFALIIGNRKLNNQ